MPNDRPGAQKTNAGDDRFEYPDWIRTNCLIRRAGSKGSYDNVRKAHEKRRGSSYQHMRAQSSRFLGSCAIIPDHCAQPHRNENFE